MKKDIKNINDIQLFVNNFYDKIQKDDLLKDIFNPVIQDQWPKHLEKMYRFWQTVLLDEHTYFGSPFVPHAKLPVEKKHFDLWLKLFYETLDEHFSGEKSEEAKWRASKMAEMFYSKIKFYRNHPDKQII